MGCPSSKNVPDKDENKNDEDPALCDDQAKFALVEKINPHNNNDMTQKSDRNELLKLFKSSDESDDFNEFINEYPDKFVSISIDIILDKTADSKAEIDLGITLFQAFRSDSEWWLDLEPFLQNELKHKLLKGIIDLESTDKIQGLTHIIAVIAKFEEWNELILTLIDLTSSRDTKLKILQMIGSWCPDRLKYHSHQIGKIIYDQILKDMEKDIDLESQSLFGALNGIIKNMNNKELLAKIMKITMVFILKKYITNWESIKLFDSTLNINMNVFNEIHFNMNESYNAISVCFELLPKFYGFHKDHIPLRMKDELFFMLCVFLKVNGNKIKNGQIQFPKERNLWGKDEWNFATVSESIFSVFFQIHQHRESDDYFDKYFKGNVSYNLIENIISNINYDIEKSIFHVYSDLLQKLAMDYIQYIWHRNDLFVPLLNQPHPDCTMLHVSDIREKLYNQEWFAVRWFIRNNYSHLYDQLHIPIMELILKYFSDYLSFYIMFKDDDDGKLKIADPYLRLKYDLVPIHDNSFDFTGINYNVQNENLSENEKNYLMDGFIKTLVDIDYTLVPKEVISVIFDFYPSTIEYFDVYKKDDFYLNDNNTLITLTKSDADHTVYGRINIEPKNKDIHCWIFKVMSKGQIGFGLDESYCKMINSSFLAPSEDRAHYNYADTGGKYNMKENYKPYGDKFAVNDVITMLFDANERTLRFYKNGKDQGINTDRIDLRKTFKMAVSLYFSDRDIAKGFKNASVSLISYKCCVYKSD